MMRFLRENKFLLLSFLAFASLIPFAYPIILSLGHEGGSDGIGGLVLLFLLLPIFVMLRLGVSLVNLHRDVEDAINRHLGQSILAFGFYYLPMGLLLLLIELTPVMLLVSVIVITAGFLAFKRYFVPVSVELFFSLYMTVGRIMVGGGPFSEAPFIISYVGVPSLLSLFLTAVIVQTSVEDEKYFADVDLFEFESPRKYENDRDY